MTTAHDNDSDAILAIAHQLGLEPAATQAAFNYCLCQLMVEAGQTRLVAKNPGDDGPLCHFLSADREVFVVPVSRPRIGKIEVPHWITLIYLNAQSRA